MALGLAFVGGSAEAGVDPPAEVGLVSAAHVVPMTETLAGGVIELHRFTLHGIAVRGAFELTRRSPDGRHRVLASHRPRTVAQLRPDEAHIDAVALPRAVARALGETTSPTPERPPELVYRVILGEPVLAWEVQLPLTLWPEPSRRTLWISATSGALIDAREHVFASRTRVFPENPSATPTPIEVTLDEIDADGPGVGLVGARLRSLNCVDVPPATVEPWHDDGDCWAAPRVYSDLAGDFFVPLPDVIVTEDNLDGDDLYAELSMYVHGERFLAAMAARGLTAYRCESSTMLANVRGLEPSDTLPFTPLDNAYFTDTCVPEDGPTMLFGQGTDVDFAFDADVIYHELGHGIVAMLAPEGLGAIAMRSDGVTPDANAVNEAIADYVAAMITDDPELGEYVGRFWTAQDVPWIRSALNDTRCPDDVIGESHADGEPLMAALWATRVEIGAVLDEVVLLALGRMAPDVTLESTSQVLLEVAGELRDEGRLSADDVAVLEQELVARGLPECPRVIRDAEQVAAGRTMFLRRTSASVAPFWPGPMQLRHVVADDRDSLVVALELTPRGGDAEVGVSVLVKRDDAPIAFDYALVTRDTDGDPSGGSGRIREVIAVEGDWELEVAAVRRAGALFEAEVRGLRPGEVVHLALAATLPADMIASRVRVLDGAVSESTSSSSSDDTAAGDGDGPERVTGSDPSSSCACTPAPRSDALALVTLLALCRRRSRR